ncbi:MAG: hypothetical protein KKH34_01895 [Candidatus Omnitrophica bacterium]|nr:hypothetical protein [Candidatus Omnitrophota bacterium]
MKLNMLVFILLLTVAEICTAAGEIVVDLQFPKKSTDQIKTLEPVIAEETVSGTIVLDISPYPAEAARDRYLVEYYHDAKLIYSTDGYDESNPQSISFKYSFDTTKFSNGKYKLYVNFWDKRGAPAVGGKKIVINNP